MNNLQTETGTNKVKGEKWSLPFGEDISVDEEYVFLGVAIYGPCIFSMQVSSYSCSSSQLIKISNR